MEKFKRGQKVRRKGVSETLHVGDSDFESHSGHLVFGNIYDPIEHVYNYNCLILEDGRPTDRYVSVREDEIESIDE